MQSCIANKRSVKPLPSVQAPLEMQAEEAEREDRPLTESNAGKRAIASVDCLRKAAVPLSHPQHIDDNAH